jgi:hypothetical protein
LKKETLSVKSTQIWLQELSEAAEKMIEALQRERALREEAEARGMRIAELEEALLSAKARAEQAEQDALKWKAEAELAAQQATEVSQTQYSSPSSNRGAIEIAPEFIDKLVSEIDACLMKLKQ